MQKQAGRQRFLEQAQDVERILQIRVRIFDIQPSVIVFVAFADAGAELETRASEQSYDDGLALYVLFFKLGQENPRQFADVGCVAEVVLHEQLDRAARRRVLVAEPLGDIHLHVEMKLILWSARQVVQMATHRPKERLGADEFFKLLN